MRAVRMSEGVAVVASLPRGHAVAPTRDGTGMTTPAPHWLALWLAGLPGVLAVALLVVPALAKASPLPVAAVVALSAAQSALLLAFAVWVGGRCAPATGLRAPFLAALRTPGYALPALRPPLLAGLAGGVAGAAVLLVSPRLRSRPRRRSPRAA